MIDLASIAINLENLSDLLRSHGVRPKSSNTRFDFATASIPSRPIDTGMDLATTSCGTTAAAHRANVFAGCLFGSFTSPKLGNLFPEKLELCICHTLNKGFRFIIQGCFRPTVFSILFNIQ